MYKWLKTYYVSCKIDVNNIFAPGKVKLVGL